MRYHVNVGDLTFEVEIDDQGVWIDGSRMDACAPEPVSPDLYSFLMDGASYTVLPGEPGLVGGISNYAGAVIG